VAGKNYVAALQTSSAADGKAELDELMAIVDKYIARSSPFEVNIDSRTKDAIFAQVETFEELSLVRAISLP